MNNGVKELFNSLYIEENKESRLYKYRKRKRRVGIMPYRYFEIAPITNLAHFINCEISPTICPIQWEDLEIDLSSSDKRHCEYCNKSVYKVDNEFMLRKMQDENKCMAISNTLLEKMNGKMNEHEYEMLQNRLIFSMLFIVYKKSHEEEFDGFIKRSLTQEQILKEIILDILKSDSEIKNFIAHGVDVETILHHILAYSDDKEFKQIIEKKIATLMLEGI